ncbi:SCP2 sterol-binding domain-containing protein [Virgibacillus salinus]|uniref:SCP-2 sterol transfer family protein n=1 Tax=Virgibacillus salinus TaxID=553311 RepID=A0A1H0XNW0_9BACI|nr:SCP2 sterol-binding domain-containing protein [Virgibacillus salinus]SDQ04326.1 SCP-2 sterol transfer family protein [Virgibacillus salinus]
MESLEKSPVKEVWDLIDQLLQANKAPYEDVNAIYQFHLIDEEDGHYQLEFKNGVAMIYYTNEKDPDCILKMKVKHFKKFLLGNLNSTTAFMTGKLKIDGNISLALKLEAILKQYQLES